MLCENYRHAVRVESDLTDSIRKLTLQIQVADVESSSNNFVPVSLKRSTVQALSFIEASQLKSDIRSYLG